MAQNGCVAYRSTLTVTTLMEFRHALMNTGNDNMGIQNELGLERDKSVVTKQRWAEHTLNTWRSLVMSDFHAVIASLSSLEWRNREILPRPLRSSTFFRISLTVL